MPTITYTPLATKTLTATATSVTFSSISQSYRDLILVIDTLGTGTFGKVALYLNGVTTGYSDVKLSGAGTAAASVKGYQAFLGYYVDLLATYRSSYKVDIFEYSQTNKYKSFLTMAHGGGTKLDKTGTLWSSNSAVSSIVATAIGDGQFAIGSTFTLYGIVA